MWTDAFGNEVTATTVCNAPDTLTAHWKFSGNLGLNSANITPESTIAVNYKIKQSKCWGLEGSLRLVVYNPVTKVTEYVTDYIPETIDGVDYYTFSYKTFAYDIRCTYEVWIEAKVDMRGELVWAKGKSITYGVHQYCTNKISATGSSNVVKTLCNAILEYGKAATTYFYGMASDTYRAYAKTWTSDEE